MGVVLLPALIPDIEKVYDVYFAAFKNEPMAEIMLGVLFPGGITPEFRKEHTKATLDWWHKSDSQYTGKVVDLETGEIIGMLLADIFLKERSDEERQWMGIPWLEGPERERAEAITRPLWEMREKLFGGRKYIYVHVIGITPSFQGLKAGAAMIDWGIKVAEAADLPIYVEASPSTWVLYTRYGFERIEEKVIHSKELTQTEEDIDVPLMVRMPPCAKGMGFEEWRAKGYPAFE
ncbi:hypothetical protein AYO21_10695 [Fonsecaea monophora]|uniref:Uncharacterized protein n=1 Tax=Fonsecaea monophora TaxID=254056 RepID=A0A177ET54_9EURO|nr:hypothetical protein AYO21_10695 [Fonsecaea monophora]KAH0835270.1 putative GNAT family acetyltransferase [Fonsecaea pedrosoi]OAG35128.1 hypothetical protein AYO21_10695 [Fonsecaea monophora]